ncbi:MarR family transcriptional regulator [Desulforamulus putei]|uniref:DNA-binding transcriptional regulator, MarR family n=1 Tax=Desulforamulus putei DSM 12395 TaxID=1121429 RepID=A0A1M4ZQZ4_9FIRM|nr:MarR family transcriptional regulator [Desulforamulus putei]SHF20510.1 DNA-binding transcriptional regulator, MarR family [Desulforamulus putei DSM 12395]
MADKEYLIGYVKRLEAAFTKTMKKLGPKLSSLEEGLTQPQFFVLGLLKNNPRTVTEIAEIMGVQPSAITAILDRMYKSGFILRERNEEDRRVVVVYITEKGKEVFAKAQKKRLDIITRYLGYLEREELEQLLNIYEKLAKILETEDAKRN